MFRSWSLKSLSMRARAEESPREAVGLGGAQVLRPRDYGTIRSSAMREERETVYATRVEDNQAAQETSSLLPRATTVPSAPPLPMAHAVSSAVVAGVPVVPPPEKDSGAEGSQHTSSSHVGEMTRPGFSLGVDGDLEDARIAAMISARQDNHEFDRNGSCEAQARQRVEQEERDLQIARINARRRDAEGLNMPPHPGNRVDSIPQRWSLRSEKVVAYGATTMGVGKGDYEKAGGQESHSGSSQKESGEDSSTAGGYQTSEYEPAEYQVSEYKSVYDS